MTIKIRDQALYQEEKARFDKWYPKLKFIPQNKQDQRPEFNSNPEVLKKYSNFLIDEISKNTLEGIMCPIAREKPTVISAWVVADSKKLRKCFDGGIIKCLEKFKTPCKLDAIPDFVDMLSKDDLMSKIEITEFGTTYFN